MGLRVFGLSDGLLDESVDGDSLGMRLMGLFESDILGINVGSCKRKQAQCNMT